MNAAESLREEIFAKVKEYYELVHAERPFVPGETRLQYGGRVFDERELVNMVDAVLEFWLTEGRFAEQLEQGLREYLGVREVIPVNSGSSANLVAVSTLCARGLPNRLLPGDEVITPATTFPTTLAPIVQNRLVPVLVDCELGTYNLDSSQLGAALSEKTRAVFVPHTLGNPAQMDRVVDFCRGHGLFLIEDTCDALGSKFAGKPVGTFGDLATASFYPAHHMTTGEGGAVYTDSVELGRLARILRDWGRDNRNLAPGHNNYRYHFTEIGYNLKMTDIQAALGVPQVKKLPLFGAARRRNFQRLYSGLRRWETNFVLPCWSPEAEPSWFAFPLTVRDGSPFRREVLMDHLENRGIETRVLFGGNILKQPGFRDIVCRVIGELPNAEVVSRATFFVGVYPGLDDVRMDYILESFEDFLRLQRPAA